MVIKHANNLFYKIQFHPVNGLLSRMKLHTGFESNYFIMNESFRDDFCRELNFHRKNGKIGGNKLVN